MTVQPINLANKFEAVIAETPFAVWLLAGEGLLRSGIVKAKTIAPPATQKGGQET